MLERPKFKPHFHVQVAPDEDVVYLLSEKGHSALRGFLYRVLAPLMDGTHTVGEITERLKDIAQEERIRYAVERLDNQGYLVDAAHGIPPESTAAYWHLHGIDAGQANWPETTARVAVHTFGQVAGAGLCRPARFLGDRH